MGIAVMTDETEQYKKLLRTARQYFPIVSKKKVVDLAKWRKARDYEKHAKEKLHVK